MQQYLYEDTLLRDREEYKLMTDFKAVGAAEGFAEASEIGQLCAWQYLIDKELCWSLQGFFGRTAKELIDNGTCLAKEKIS